MFRAAMMRALRWIGSTRAALWWLLALIVTIVACRFGPREDYTPVALPLAVIAVSIAVGMVTNRRMRSSLPLAVFHASLSLLCVLAGLAVVWRFEGRVEIVEGTAFAPESVEVVRAAPGGRQGPAAGAFEQADVRVHFRGALHRERTESVLQVGDRAVVLSDKEGFVVDGFRFAPTSNKGFALALTWRGDDGSVESGWLHLPSFPAFEWKQENVWQTPGGMRVTIGVVPPAVPQKEAWVLDRRLAPRAVHVIAGDERTTTTLGGAVRVPGGKLQVDEVRLWMGYRVTRDPAAPWLFVVASVGLAALGLHVWRGPSRRRAVALREREETDGLVRS